LNGIANGNGHKTALHSLRSFAALNITASIFIIWLGLYVFTTMKLKQAKHSTHTLHFHFEGSEGKESDENVR
jgi:hypothetical protein